MTSMTSTGFLSRVLADWLVNCRRAAFPNECKLQPFVLFMVQGYWLIFPNQSKQYSKGQTERAGCFVPSPLQYGEISARHG